MNILRILVMALLAVSVVAAEPTWNPADAVKEAEQDIRTGHIKFYWSGSIASMPVGVPIEIAKKYPKANAGVGCVTNDTTLNIARTGAGVWIDRAKEITPAENGGSNMAG